MNQNSLIALACLAVAATAPAQITNVKGDTLGAHLNYGRGCGACHEPHRGSVTSGPAPSADASTGMVALWGEDVSGQWSKVTQPAAAEGGDGGSSGEPADTPDVRGLVACLSCHDGNYASPAMMRNRMYEKLPAQYDTGKVVPTLMGVLGPLAGDYLSEHPVGLSAVMKCGGAGNWDCNQSEGVVTMRGAKSSQFVRDYGFFVKPADYNNTAVVVCTTCHNPHLMNVFSVGPGSRSGLPPGTYSTMFFLRGPYNPLSTNPRSDQTAQFCRQCHAAESNEMYGAMIATVF